MSICYKYTTTALRSTIILLAMCCLFSGSAGVKQLQTMKDSVNSAIDRLDWKTLFLIVPRYQKEAEKSGDLQYLSHALYASSKADLRYSYNPDAAEPKLKRAIRYADAADSDSLRALAWHTYGMLEFLHHNNPAIGQDYLLKAADYAKKAAFRKELYFIYGELSEICIAQKDSLGKKYAGLVYEYGKKASDPHLVAQGAYSLSYFNYIDGNFKEALEYLKITETKLEKDGSDSMFTIYAMYAALLTAAGNLDEADKYIDKILADPLKSDYLPRLSALKARMTILAAKGKYSEAIASGKEALEMADAANIHYLDNDIYRAMADNHRKSGDYKSACEWMERLTENMEEKQRDISHYARNERQIALRMAESDKEADIKKLEISRMRWIILLLTISFIAVIMALWTVFRKKTHVSKLYSNIVAQQTAAIKREHSLHDKIEQLEKQLAASQKRSYPGAEGEKSSSIYANLYEMVEKDRLWADPQINRDILAERLNTNRSYLSKIIKDNADMNLPQFLNQFRIREAIEILSGQKSNEPMTMEEVADATGFNSKRVFFTVFKEWVGMSPVEFKERADKKSKFAKKTS